MRQGQAFLKTCCAARRAERKSPAYIASRLSHNVAASPSSFAQTLIYFASPGVCFKKNEKLQGTAYGKRCRQNVFHLPSALQFIVLKFLF